MSFTVEDGTIVEGANSLVPLAYADTFHADRDNSAWTGEDSAKQSALIRATDYIEQEYSHLFIGSLVSEYQPLSFPRKNIVSVESDTVPTKVKQAVCILALEALSSSLNPNQDKIVKKEKIDVLEFEYMENKTGKTKRHAVDGILRPFLKSRYSAEVIRS